MVWKWLFCRPEMAGDLHRTDPKVTETSNREALHITKGFSVSARNPLNAVTGLLKPVSGGCTDQRSCCEMPAPLEKQTNRKPWLNRQRTRCLQRFFLVTRFANFQKALHIRIFLQEIKENHRFSLCPFLLWAPLSSPIEKGGFGRVCRLKGLSDHCSSITKGNARWFFFSQAGVCRLLSMILLGCDSLMLPVLTSWGLT